MEVPRKRFSGILVVLLGEEVDAEKEVMVMLGEDCGEDGGDGGDGGDGEDGEDGEDFLESTPFRKVKDAQEDHVSRWWTMGIPK